MARRPLDVPTLVAGIAFAVIGLVSLLGDLSLEAQVNLVWPVLLAALGLSLLLPQRSRDHDHDHDHEDQPS